MRKNHLINEIYKNRQKEIICNIKSLQKSRFDLYLMRKVTKGGMEYELEEGWGCREREGEGKGV